VPTVDEVFALALRHHQGGQLDLAERLYHQILQADPGHADSHHLLGVVAYQTGHYAQAVTSISQALTLNPWAGVYHSNLGVVYEASGQKEKALASFQEALRLQPGSAEAHNAVGNALRALGRQEEAAAYCRQALRMRPDYPEAHNNLGNALYLQEKLDEAGVHYTEALRLKPDYAEAHGHLGLVLADKGRIDEALAHFHDALRLNPNNAEVHSNLSIALLKANKLEEAITHCQEALRLKPDFAGAHNNLGIALRRQGRLEEAEAHCRQALGIIPDFPEAHNSLATALLRQANWEASLTHYHQALRLKPNFPEARWNRSLLWLALGDFEQGWPEYEWRWTQPGHTRRQFRELLWDGSDLAGRTILLYAEQGLGDTLHFIRYAPLVKQRGGKNVIVECRPQLLRLLAGVPGIDQLVAEGSPLPAFDVQAALLSLPGIFHTTLDTIPATVPYLHPDAQLVEQWRKSAMCDVRCAMSEEPHLTSHIAHRTSHVLVGIGWQGSPTYGYDNLRSFPLRHFERLAQVEGVQLISLQKGPGTDQLEQLRIADCGLRIERQETNPLLESAIRNPKSAIVDLGSRLDEDSGPFMDSAAIIKNLDLVVCSDTALPHLAGALGVPVWLALPLVPDWRWLLEREDNPWYPSMRLFRQTRQGQWEGVFDRMAEELQAVVNREPRTE